MVSALDPLGELDLLGGGQERDLADVLEEELERVGRDLARLRLEIELGVVVFGDDLDVQLVESGVEILDLIRVEIELVKGDRDLVMREKPCFLPLPHERQRGVVAVGRPLHGCSSPLDSSHLQTPSLTVCRIPRAVNGSGVTIHACDAALSHAGRTLA